MSPTPEKVAEALRASAKEAQRLRRENQRLLAAAAEPVAIVGMSCRLPGEASSPERFWDLVAGGRDAIGDIPEDRGWDVERLFHPDPDHPGTSYVREGGFLHDAGEFDAEFFGLTPREALAMDPQQRLLLEASWEALEDAGIDPSSIRGSQTGVFAGVMYQDYPPDPKAAAAGHAVTSNTGSIVSGRVAYLFGLVGPTMTVDTACSSSLVALHLACTALRKGECSMALAGGVTVMAQPSLFVAFSMQRGLARDGRCKSFADSADGTNWGEGVGVLALERLSDASRNGHRILAVIRGSAVNQDGASNGFTSPNGPSQQRVIQQALQSAGLSTHEVDAVEAHGTGTTLGDPIEAQALLSTYGLDRPHESPLLLGSVKSNIGHVQAAAGVAGVIKMVQALRHELLPQTLHVDAPTRHVDWAAGAVELLTEPRPWPRGERPRRAGVSSFGISGTNAHLIVEEAPRDGELMEADQPDLAVLPWLISGKSEPAVREQAERLHSHLQAHPELAPLDVAFSLATARTRFERRAAVVGGEREQLLERLERLARGEVGSGVFEREAGRGKKTAFMFTGQGAQRAAMGAELCGVFPVFAEALDGVCAELDPHLGRSLKELLFVPKDSAQANLLEQTEFAQASLFAIELALCALLRSLGVEPDALIGHSIGEIVAAHVAGVFSLADACRLVAARGRLMGALPEGGGMLAVEAHEHELSAELEHFQDLALAAVNGPRGVVLSGPVGELDAFSEHWRERGRKTSRLRVSHAFHSHLMEPMLEEFRDLIEELRFDLPKIPIVSNSTGRMADASELTTADYWVRHVRHAVRFGEGVRSLRAAGVRRFLEVGPDGVLSAMAADCLAEQAEEPVLVAATLRAGRSESEALTAFLAEVHVDGGPVDWGALFAGRATRTVDLPTYAFQRRRYWHERWAGVGDLATVGLRAVEHPLLGAAMALAGERGWTCTAQLSLTTHPWLADHAVFGAVIVPGACLVELALAAGRELGCDLLEELTFEAPIVLPASGEVQLQIGIGEPDDAGSRRVDIHSRQQTDIADDGQQPQWICHAIGALGTAVGLESPDSDRALEGLLKGAWPPEGCESLELGSFYEELAQAGLSYGPAFQGVGGAWIRDGEIFAEVTLDGPQLEEAERFGLHPALLDAALHSSLLARAGDREQDGLQLPFSVGAVRLHKGGVGALRVGISSTAEHQLSFVALDEHGEPALSIGSLRARPVESHRLQLAQGGSERLLYLDWAELVRDTVDDEGHRPEPVAIGDLGALGFDDAFEQSHRDLSELGEAMDGGGQAPDLLLVAASPLSASGDGGSALIAAAHGAVERMRVLLQDWLAEARLVDTRLTVLTRGAMGVLDGEVPDPVGAAVWGLVRAAQAEHPGRIQLLDLDPDGGAGEPPWSALLDREEPQIALRAGRAYVPRLAPVSDRDREAAPPTLDPDRTVLITGGTGGLGGLVAAHLARAHGIRHLLLVSRRGEQADGAFELVRELAELGCSARVVACDVSKRDELASAIEAIPEDRPLTAVIHAAGVIEDATIASLGADQLASVMRAKVDAAVYLQELTEQTELAEFILFSSAAGVIGSPGQANYSAANAFLDAFAQDMSARDSPMRSLAWGMWAAGVGMTGRLAEADMARMGRLGVDALTAEEGLELFDAARASRQVLSIPVRLDLDALREHAGLGVLPAVLRGLVRAPTRRVQAGGAKLARRLAEVAESEREALVLELVRQRVASVLGHDSGAAIDPHSTFQDLGVDSLAAVELRNVLGQLTGLRLAATLVFDYPTPIAVAKFLQSSVEGVQAVERHAPRRSVAEEPIAIVGMSCRYPGGVCSPEDLWRLVCEGADAVSSFPTDRGWDLERLYNPDPDSLGTTYVNEGGFLYDAPEFDAGFFQISPREAASMDPQQRLLLEASWEAIEGAGIDPRALHGSQTGVFAGVMYQDYGLAAGSGLQELEGNLLPGAGGSVVSGRVAYSLGLEGPAITVDTACSSSLVAMHLACRALRQGECSLALAGGVTIYSTPTVYLAFSRMRGLAADGRCKPFADAADGIGWSEGVGLLALERLSEARRLGHPVLALVRGSAVNQDGASNGFTAPNGPSQERVIRQALADAGLDAGEVDAVEAHGTGTTLGDPIEAQALLATYGQGRTRPGPLWLGSVKSNLGHTQAAAGVAGAIKMVMALRHGLLPKLVHLDRPSRHVDWSAGAVSPLSENVPWPQSDAPRRAGVSSFGMSGTNAHVILEEAPAADRALVKPSVSSGVVPGAHQGAESSASIGVEPTVAVEHDGMVPDGVAAWVLSGRGGSALHSQAQRLLTHLDGGEELSCEDVGLSLAKRSSFESRAVVIGRRDELFSGLRALSEGRPRRSVLEGEARRSAGATAFLFTGGGGQRAGMGRELYRTLPVFKEALDEVLDCFEDDLGDFLRRAMVGEENAHQGQEQDAAQSLLDEMRFSQTSLFALEVALFRLLAHWGMRPDYLLGHSLGELVAAHAGGVLCLEDACRLVSVRSRLMEALPPGGLMVAVEASEQEILETLQGTHEKVALAAVNGPRAVVLSGDEQATLELAGRWAERGRKIKPIRLSHASHSHRMDGMLAELAGTAGELSFAQPTIPVLSNLTGEPLSREQLSKPSYWAEHVRGTVRFADGVRWLGDRGVENFLELGPDGILSPMCLETLLSDAPGIEGAAPEGEGETNAERPEPRERSEPVAVPLLRRGERSEMETLLGAIATLWVRGVEFDWSVVPAHASVAKVSLPTYSFQRQRYWLGDSIGKTSVHQEPSAIARGSLLRRIHQTKPSERSSVVMECVREQIAVALGYDSPEEIDPHRNLLELGFDSLMAVELRTRLNRLASLHMSTRVMLDYPTTAALAAYIEPQLLELPIDLLEDEHAVDCEADVGSTEAAIQDGTVGPSEIARGNRTAMGALTSMLGVAREQGSSGQFMELLMSASRFRESFDRLSAPDVVRPAVRLSEGEDRLELICVPTVLAMSGPHQYVRFARALAGRRTVSALAVPGFVEAERVPRDLDAAVEALALAVEERASEEPYALVGYSSGGWLAHAVASRLEDGGQPVEALVLIDTLPPMKDGPVDLIGALLDNSLVDVQSEGEEAIGDDRLTAMGAYIRLLAGWEPQLVQARTLLVQADQSLAGLAGQKRSEASWEIPLESVRTPGDHFTMIEEHAEATAHAIDRWLVNAIEGEGVEEIC